MKNIFFRHILTNNLLVGIANNFLWFALVFWAYLETHSVLVTSLIGGLYLVSVLISGIFFGAIVDHNKKKTVMAVSTVVSLLMYAGVGALYLSYPANVFANQSSMALWILVLLVMVGVVVGNIRMITLSTMVTLLFEADKRDKANGMVGMVNGIGFAVVSVFSGIVIGQLGMGWAIAITIAVLTLGFVHVLWLKFPIDKKNTGPEEPKTVDLRGTFLIILAIKGLIALILFSMFNNFLGGVFMSLMDAYGLALVSVETWGFIWGFLSLGFIIGGFLVAKW